MSKYKIISLILIINTLNMGVCLSNDATATQEIDQEANRFDDNVINVILRNGNITYEHKGIIYDDLKNLFPILDIKYKFIIHIKDIAKHETIRKIYLEFKKNNIRIDYMTIVYGMWPPNIIPDSIYLQQE